MTLTSHDLLHKVLDLLCYKKENKRYYDIKYLKNEPPSYYRLLQIEALMDALGLSKKHFNTFVNTVYRLSDKAEYDRRTYLNSLTNLEYLLRGEFFDSRDIDVEYSEIKQKISDNARQHVPGLGQHYYERPLNLPWLFSLLINYRIDIHQFTRKPTGFIEGFDISAFYGSLYASRHCGNA
ncbi:MAG TPA: hypothetical protein VEC12_12645 [Bacteroidia bacterium]|nr:hypothetical protein [Bacteroidia bacterium]